MKLRTGDPWMPAAAYSATLTGISFNLLVRDIEAALRFQREVLGVEVVYSDPDFAVVRGHGGEFMFHADHTYDKHPIAVGIGRAARGRGVELRVYGLDPDAAEAAARESGFEVLAPTMDKGHGLREVFLLDADGYCWVPGRPVAANPA